MLPDASPQPPPDDRVVEARLGLRPDGVIAGMLSAGEAEPMPFHGWLELMDALERVRHGLPREQTPPPA